MDRFRDIGGRGWNTGRETLGGFRKFILRGSVVDLAVGIVIGAAFTAVVTGLVNDFFQPLIGLFFKTDSLNTVKAGPFLWGHFVGVVITFLLTAAVLYFFVVLPITKLQDRFTPHKEPEAPKTRECPFCLSTVPIKAIRCAYCTADLPPVDAPSPQPSQRG